tara:strand:- start:1915 stop:2175 length:261 start_codon:yes stop_codon:yes gene_type:complete
MIAFLFSMAGLLNLLFYVFAIGFVISLIIEQFVKENEKNLYIVQTNRRYCWRQAWIVNINWFACNIGLFFLSRNMAAPVDTFWNGM